jgi:hypothetical protein
VISGHRGTRDPSPFTCDRERASGITPLGYAAFVSLRANPKLAITVGAVPGQPGAWIMSSEGVNAAGQPVSLIPASCEQAAAGALGSHRGTTAGPGSTALNNCVAGHGIRVAESYQPASHYWPLQWSETGMFLALALACSCCWRLNRRS